MTRTTASARPWFFWPLIAFVAGLLIGLIVIGWGLWPVQWTNALPSDLRSDLQYQYLTMVAESYAATGDLPVAQQRLESFTTEELGRTLVDLQEYLINTDARRATQVQGLIAALRLDSSRPAIPTPPPAGAATPVTARLTSLCTSVLWAVLVIGAVAFLAWLFLRWRKAEGGGVLPEGGLPALVRSIRLPGRRDARTPDDIIAAEKAHDVAPPRTSQPTYTGTVSLRPPQDEARYVREEDVDFDTEPPDDEFEEADEPPPTDWRYDTPPTEPRRTPPVEPPPLPVEPPRRTLPEAVTSVPAGRASEPSTRGVAPEPQSVLPRKLGEYVALYPDDGQETYAAVFDLKDDLPGVRDQDRYLGQCSVAVHRPETIARGPVYAFQLWLSDRRDSDYQVKVLMSDGAYRNTALRAEYAGQLDVEPLRPGREVEMSTRNLILRARIEELEYDETQQPLHGVIARLQLRLIAYKRP